MVRKDNFETISWHVITDLRTFYAFSSRGEIAAGNWTLFRTLLIRRAQTTACIHIDAKMQWKWVLMNTSWSIRAVLRLHLHSRQNIPRGAHACFRAKPATHICRWRRLCQTALSSGVGARKMRTRLRSRLCGLQPPLFIVSAWPLSTLPFGCTATCSRNSVGLFRTVKHASAMLDNRKGSSVTKSTRSRDTRANTRRSVNSNAQDGCKRARPSTLARAPPKSLKHRSEFLIIPKYDFIWYIKSYFIIKSDRRFTEINSQFNFTESQKRNKYIIIDKLIFMIKFNFLRKYK